MILLHRPPGLFSRPIVRSLAALLAVLLLLPSGLTVAGAQEPRPAIASRDTTSAASSLDFSAPASEATEELTASVFLALLTGEEIGSAEAAYIDSMLVENPFTYSTAIPQRQVETTYDDNTLSVTAHPYTYTAVNGQTVTYTPTDMVFAGTTYTFEHDATTDTYTRVLADIPESTDSLLTVHYRTTLTIPAAAADLYRNYAHRYAEGLVREEEAYRSLLAAYEAWCKYQAEKQAYDKAYAAWQDYLTAQKKYEDKYAAYVTYQKELATYRELLARYEAYVTALEQYNTDKSTYDDAKAAYIAATDAYKLEFAVYDTYQKQLAQITDSMASLESAFIRNSKGKQMYATLMGDTVATVVNRKAELIAGGCDPKDIDTAATATAMLQEHLTTYKSLSTQAEKFVYYQANYTVLREQFIALYGSLRSLYNNGVVKKALITYERLERYIEFLSQLYVISSGLDDTRNRAEDWVLYGEYDPDAFGNKEHTYQTELEPIQIPPDKNNADPADLTYPAAEIPEPTPPEAFTLTEPQKPVEVLCPLEPDAVTEPVKPTPVSEPTAPVPVPDPGLKQAPIAPTFTDLQTSLIAAYRNGTLAHREETGDTLLDFSATLDKRMSLQNKRLVEFFDYDEKTLLYTTEQNDGETITYSGEVPHRADTDKYHYRFVGWKDADGNLVDDLGVVDDRHEVFYASYEAILRTYTVTWSVDGTDTAVTYHYGEIPAFGSTPVRPETAQYTYTFTGWTADSQTGATLDLPAVVGDITYTATFESILRYYPITWLWADQSSVAEWAYGETPSLDDEPIRPEDERFLYTFTGWDISPAPVTGPATYTALYTATPIIAPAEGKEDPTLQPTLQDDNYLAAVPAAGLQVDRLFALAALREYTVTLTSSNGAVTLSFNEAAVADMNALGCTFVHIDSASAKSTDGPVRYTVRFLRADGEAVTLQYPVTLRVTDRTEATRVYDTSTPNAPEPLPFTLENGTAILKLNTGVDILLRDEYTVTVIPCEHGILSADTERAEPGSIVRLSHVFSEDYETAYLRVIGQTTGTEYPLEADLSFTMPTESVQIEAALRLKTYTVTFVVDGETISTETYHRGDTVRIPDDPVKAQEDTTIYTFIGWSPVVSTVTEDATYTAQFKTSTQSDNNVYIPPDSKNREYLLFIELGLILAVLIATPIVIVKLVKRRKRKKKASPAALSPQGPDAMPTSIAEAPTDAPADAPTEAPTDHSTEDPTDISAEDPTEGTTESPSDID